MTTEEAARVLKKMYDDGMRTEKGWASIVPTTSPACRSERSSKRLGYLRTTTTVPP